MASLTSLFTAVFAFFSVAQALPSLATGASSGHLEPRRIPAQAKYFYEASGSLARVHYDIRYFKEEVPYDEHRLVLRDLIRSYLGVMPWDYDLDVQVSNDTLQWLGDSMNRTEHAFEGTTYVDGWERPATKTYLLDVNPHHSDLTRGDGANVIDARWIDMQTGLFIDITGVREREASRPGVWSCKNYHRYEARQLWPLRPTKFEGVPALVPYSYQDILTDEYGHKSIVAEEWEHHRWDSVTKQWRLMSQDEENQRKEEAKVLKAQDLALHEEEEEEQEQVS
uniref:LicD/FKTN/FKRP nucleotidyltransferase domain-containing protein n=2 Tax=Bionectria ochroleuca TaxID=29856 RepID=A0A0B7JRT1_BIOOC